MGSPVAVRPPPGANGAPPDARKVGDPGANDSLANCRFYVRIGNETQAVFTEVSGLQVETTVQEFEEGGNNGFVHKLPGRTKVGNLTLKRGVTKGNEFYNWYASIVAGKIERKNLSLVIFSPVGEVVAQWDFEGAFPVKWVGPQLVADGAALAVETLELAHNGLSRAK
jgi:phage tail-like protein